MNGNKNWLMRWIAVSVFFLAFILNVKSTPLSGVYFIDKSGGGNYTKIQDAIDDLGINGVSGPVVFIIKSGTYYENLVIKSVSGASATNTITFGGQYLDSVTISSTAASTILLDGADFTTWTNLTIENPNTLHTDVLGVTLINHANNNQLVDCKVSLSNTYYRSCGIFMGSSEYVASSGNNDSNLIQNCTITGGYYAIRCNGAGSVDPSFGNEVIKCNINAYYYGVYLTYNRFYNIENSLIRTTANYFPTRLYYNGDGHICNNEISGKYGLNVYYENFYFGDSSLVTNNFVYGDFVTYNLTNSRVYHNTIQSMYYGLYLQYSANNHFKNNIFDLSSSTYACYIYGTFTNNIFDRNIFYSGTNRFYVNKILYNNLDDAFDALACSPGIYWIGMPSFVSTTDMHLDASMQPKYGLAGLPVTVDIDGDSRCTWGPTVGADESKYPMPVPGVSFKAEDSFCFNQYSSAVNLGLEDDPVGYKWYVNGVYQSSSFHLTYLSDRLGKDTIMLKSFSCGGSDSLKKIVIVDMPKSKVTPEFLADQYAVETNGVVNFMDLSTHCQNSWKWTISPQLPANVFVNGTTSSSQNPSIKFPYPGTYDVCLEVDNGLGSRKTCKYDYITVSAAHNMCEAEQNGLKYFASGIVYDDGGPDTNYGANKNCSLLLEPCSKFTTLSFKEFDVAYGDYLKVYDGINGKSLWDTVSYPNGLTNMSSYKAMGKDSVLYSLTGKLYIVWTTNSSGDATGFKAEWEAVPYTFSAPTTDIIAPDTVCVGELIHFDLNTTGEKLYYEWSFTNSGQIDSEVKTPDYEYIVPGVYTVINKTISACNSNIAIDTQVVVVYQPNTPPVADFEADNRTPAAGRAEVTFNNLSYSCVDSLVWEIIPASSSMAYHFVSGNERSENPVIIFDHAGCYDVKLMVFYGGYSDTILRSCYIAAIEYCDPVVANTNTDVGISKVVLGSISNSSATGKAKYTDYTSKYSTILEYGKDDSITIERPTISNAATIMVWIDWNIDGDFNDSLELVCKKVNSKTLVFKDLVKIPYIKVGYSIMRVAISLGSTVPNPCGYIAYGEVEDYAVIILPDVTPPVITILGSENIVLNQCDAYVDSGAIVTGAPANSLIATNNLNTSVPGKYWYRYNAMDSFGNMAEKVRNITVVPDTIGPELVLKGNSIEKIEVFDTWVDPGYIVTQRCLPIASITVDSSQVNTSVVGQFKIIYTVTDSAGNVIKKTRKVQVEDLTDPVMTLNGKAIDTVTVYESWVDSGVTITDNYYTNLKATVKGTVNTKFIGDYNITYQVTDPSGNGPVTLNRIVRVIDNLPPEIVSYIYSNNDTITVDVLSKFKPPVLLVSDNYDTKFTEHESGSILSALDVDAIVKLGIFSYVYQAIDSSGNVGEFVLYIESVDREIPVITLHGNISEDICRFEVLNDSVTVSDNYDSSVTVTEGGSYITDYLVNMAPGLYVVYYSAVDQSGNNAVDVFKSVRVWDIGENGCTSGMDENVLAEKVKVYPNPSKGQVYISLSFDKETDVGIQVTNALGQVVYREEQLKLSHDIIGLKLSAGMYHIEVQNKEGRALFPVIVTD